MIGNSLDDLLKLQTGLMRILGVDPLSGAISAGGKPSMTELGAAISITCESAEILEAMEKAGRKWKEKEGSIEAEVKEELIDVVFFVLELAILLNLTGEQLANLYVEKYKKNLLRYLEATANSGGVSSLLVSAMDEQFGYAETEKIIKEALGIKEVK